MDLIIGFSFRTIFNVLFFIDTEISEKNEVSYNFFIKELTSEIL